MIFVTVGTHEQQFNRLISHIDMLKKEGAIKEEVVMQTGFSTYIPEYCKSYKFIAYSDMKKYVDKGRIIITHGGPSSIIMPLQLGKVPIVVPRRKKYDEHVNDHQLDFVKIIEKRNRNIITVDEIEKLDTVISLYPSLMQNSSSEFIGNNLDFNDRLETIVQSLFKY